MCENKHQIATLSECINSLEVPSCLIEYAERYSSIMHIEVHRQFDNLYKTLLLGHFNLTMSCNDFSGTNMPTDLYTRELFVRNAIIWYNSAFDILLQSIWIFYGFYRIKDNSLEITKDTIEKILYNCKYQDIFKSVQREKIKMDKDLFENIVALHERVKDNITNWANIMKHRGNFEFIECPFRPMITYKSIKMPSKGTFLESFKTHHVNYDSSQTIVRVSIYEAIKTIIDFHNSMIRISKLLIKVCH